MSDPHKLFCIAPQAGAGKWAVEGFKVVVLNQKGVSPFGEVKRPFHRGCISDIYIMTHSSSDKNTFMVVVTIT